jgi:hypothetical protein
MNGISTFPTFSELKQFIIERPRASICEIRDKFNQRGDDIIMQKKENCKKKMEVLAYGINADFFEYLQEFIKEGYVVCELDMLACRITDSTRYIGEGEFLPIVLSIKNPPI